MLILDLKHVYLVIDLAVIVEIKLKYALHVFLHLQILNIFIKLKTFVFHNAPI